MVECLMFRHRWPPSPAGCAAPFAVSPSRLPRVASSVAVATATTLRGMATSLSGRHAAARPRVTKPRWSQRAPTFRRQATSTR